MARVLIVRVGAMGDVLHALPAVAALRQARPDWFIDWVVDERWGPLLEEDGFSGPIVNTAFRVATRGWKKRPFAPKTIKALLEFRQLRGWYDCVVDMQGTIRSGAIGWLAGGSKLTGYADPRERPARLLYGTSVKREGVHVVDQGAALLSKACGLSLEPCAPALPRENWAESWAHDLVAGRRICVLAPGAGWAAKQWPAERFAELAKRLRSLGFECLVNASHADDPLASHVAALSGGAASIVVCNVTGLIALVRRATLLVGGDSGPMHLAAMLGVPVVALFGPTDPERNGPWGPGPKSLLRDAASVTSYKRTSAPDAGLAKINVDDVVAAVRAMI